MYIRIDISKKLISCHQTTSILKSVLFFCFAYKINKKKSTPAPDFKVTENFFDDKNTTKNSHNFFLHSIIGIYI